MRSHELQVTARSAKKPVWKGYGQLRNAGDREKKHCHQREEGQDPRMTSDTGALATPAKANRSSPTGGVSLAISMLMTTLIA